MSNQGLITFLVIGLLAGWLAGKIMKGTGYGLIGDLIVGVIGAFLGYRYIYVDYENEDDQFLFDMGMGGPVAGLGFSF